MSEWKEVTLGESGVEIIDGDRGKNYPHGNDFSDSGYCLFLNAKNVTVKGFCFEEKMFITQEKDEQLKKGRLNRGDVVLTTRGTVGNVGYFKADIPYNNLRINSGMVILRCNAHFIDSRFFQWQFRSPAIAEQILSIRTGSAQPQLPIAVMRGLTLHIPPLPEQKAIADTLSCLDDKIELNNQISKNLEAQAQAIFKSWFVDFEPFQDGEFVDSELGRIPKGWSVGTLGDVAEIQMGQSPKGTSYNENKIGTVFYQGRTDFGVRYPSIRLYTTEPERIASESDILLSVRAPVGDINIAIEKCCIGRGLASLKSNVQCNSFVFYSLSNLKENFAVYNSEGTVFGSINKDTLKNIKVIIPTETAIFDFHKIAGTIDQCILINFKQVQALTAMRDTLLPKLMSGELRVPLEVE